MADVQIIRCPTCGANNRVPLEKTKQGLEPVCGRCKTPLAVDGKPMTVTDATFSAQVERSPVPVLLDLWAPWCGPCRMVSPILDRLAADHAGAVKVVRVNVDEAPGLAQRFNALSIPTMVVLRDGEEIDRIVGADPRLRDRITPHLTRS